MNTLFLISNILMIYNIDDNYNNCSHIGIKLLKQVMINYYTYKYILYNKMIKNG